MPQLGQTLLLHKLLLCQVILNNQFAISAREMHVTGVRGLSVLLSIRQNSQESIKKITWDKEKQRFINCLIKGQCKLFGELENRVQCFPDCSLRLSNLQTQDSGVYHAAAVDTDGRIKNYSVYLDVSVQISQPNIKVREDNSSAHHSLTLTCDIDEGSQPQFFWQKDKQLLTESHRYILTQANSSLSIQNFTSTDCATYTCTVGNILGNKEMTRTLIGEDSPECKTSNHPITIIAAVICVVGLVLVAFFIRKCVTSRTDQIQHRRDRWSRENIARPIWHPPNHRLEGEILNELDRIDMGGESNGDRGVQQANIYALSSGNQPDRIQEQEDDFEYSLIARR